MDRALTLWQLVQEDRLARWTAIAVAIVLWLAVAWFNVWILLGIPLVVTTATQLRKRGYFAEEDDPDEWL